MRANESSHRPQAAIVQDAQAAAQARVAESGLLHRECTYGYRAQARSYGDYILPADTAGGFILRASSTLHLSSPKASKTTATVSYRTFAGLSFELVEHRGLRVAVLLPATEPEGLYFTADHIEELVEQLDLLFTLYGEVTGAEPGGHGLLNIAFVPERVPRGARCWVAGASRCWRLRRTMQPSSMNSMPDNSLRYCCTRWHTTST